MLTDDAGILYCMHYEVTASSFKSSESAYFAPFILVHRSKDKAEPNDHVPCELR